jgi:hypothetical protein
VVGMVFVDGDLVWKSVMRGVCEVVWNLEWRSEEVIWKGRRKRKTGGKAARGAEIGSVVERGGGAVAGVGVLRAVSGWYVRTGSAGGKRGRRSRRVARLVGGMERMRGR